MSTESAIGQVAHSLDGIAKAINNHDATPTPTPTRKQFVRDTAAKLLAAHAGTGAAILGSLMESDVVMAVNMADLIWEKTQQVRNR